jgi:hypothetical protein
MSKSRLVTGRVKTLPGGALQPDRKDFLSLDQAEPNLGIPVSSSIVGSLSDGTRYFITGSITTPLLQFNPINDQWESVNFLPWELLNPTIGETSYTGSINLSGSFFLNNQDILQQIEDSGIFKQTGSFWATTNDLEITGSFKVLLPESRSFEVSTQEGTKFEINQEGVLVLAPFENTPTPVSGGLIYSGSNEFFVGL